MPKLEEISCTLSGNKIFLTLDLRSGFQQIPIAEQSQKLLSFSTPFGRYCHQRLPFGITSTPEIFQKAMNDILHDIPGVACYIDDCIIFGQTLQEHNKALENVLTRFREVGVCLNVSKCKFAQEKVEFVGHVWSGDGVSPNPEKIKAISEMKLPATESGLRSFLGLASYIGKGTVPNFSSLAAPLWDLLASGHFAWSEKAMAAFTKLKAALLNVQRLRYFDPSQCTVVQVDASGDGLGGVLLQNGQPVVFVSRKLTSPETRYSQLEHEFLAIVFTLTRLKTYLLGINFTVQTDHRPILGLIGKPIDQLSNRLQCWLLNIQHFSFSLQHIAGKANYLADVLSRNSDCSVDPTIEESCEHTICFLLKSAPVNLGKIAHSTAVDPTLQQVVTAIQENWPSSSRKLQPYFSMRAELSLKICNQKQGSSSIIVMKGDRVIIPQVLISHMLHQLHEGHMGASKMKQLLRACAYWPGFSKDVDDFVDRCDACTVHQMQPDSPPLTPIAEAAQEPNERIAIDLTGPSEVTNGKVIFTLIDHFSRYPEAFVLNSGTSSEILKCLRKHFARFGLPKSVVTDNGAVFQSAKVDNFFKSLGILHIYCSNYHPQSNGSIERFHGTLKSRLKRILFDGTVTWDVALDRVLYDIRSSPNAVTGETPFQRFFGRPMRTKFAALCENPNRVEAAPRDIRQEYIHLRKKKREKEYAVGDKVFFRKRSGSGFNNLGVIKKVCRNSSYVVTTDKGYHRVYNQANLKRSHQDFDDRWHLAYDAAAAADPVVQPFQNVTEESIPEATRAPDLVVNRGNSHYYLRSKRADPAIYKE